MKINPIINNQMSAEIVIKIVNCLSSFITFNLNVMNLNPIYIKLYVLTNI